uniref:Flagellar secretion chaperone FliS n=1 Tax=Ammonifex degensii TaxID=42838 RepID=A0A7C1F3Z3_9THEO
MPRPAERNNLQDRYLHAAVTTAPPGRLLLMLYDGAISFLSQAIEVLEARDYEEANRLIIRAQDIIAELISALDMKYEIAHSLYQLYDYFNRRLIEANVKKDAVPATEVQGYLKELREIWARVVADVGPGMVPPPGAAGMEV